MSRARYRQFAASRVEARGTSVAVWADGVDTPVLLDADDYELAQLHDGTRSAAQVHAAAVASGQRISPSVLEGFVADLSQQRLMRRGTHEPLPPPAHTDEERHALGWIGGLPSLAARPALALAPSSVPGSRVSPGLIGGLTGLVTGRRGQANQLDVRLSVAPFLWLGRLLIWPVRSRWHLLAFLAMFAFAIALLVGHHRDWQMMSVGLLGSYRAIATAIVSATLVNIFSMSARAAAIERYTPEAPRIGLVRGVFGIPRLFVDTAGAAERAARADRMRIVGSGLVGTAAPMALSILVWFLFVDTQLTLARFCVGLTIITGISLLLRLNPLLKYDGYFLLSTAVDVPDIRERAIGAILGLRRRAWSTATRNIPYRLLLIYGAAMLGFIVVLIVLLLWLVGGWLSERFHGLGFLGLLSVMGVFMVKQYTRVVTDRSTMGHVKRPWRPTKRQKWIAGIVAAVCLMPYPYSASGDFEVLPRDRADVRALVAGDVREVLAKEGDAVKAGQVIARLDDSAQRAAVAAAEAEYTRLNADLALLKKGASSEEIEVARSRVATAKAAAELAESTARRVAIAYRGKSVTPQEYERARGAADVARQQLAEAQKQLDLVGSAARDERLQAQEADVARARAQLEYAKQELAYTRIVAPIDGRVVSSELQFARGHYLARGDQLATIADTGELLADIRIPESSIADIEVEADASLKPWAYPASSFDGRVRAIAPAAEEGAYGKVVRVQVVIEDPGNALKTGMTGNAKVDAGWSIVIVVFTRAISRFLFVELWSWIP